MNAPRRAPRPRVEDLLDAAHAACALLYDRRELLGRIGIDAEYLPDDLVLRAFALLGDHERGGLLAKLGMDWEKLRRRGLVRGAIADTTTPELRLLAHVLPLTEHLDDVSLRLQEARLAPVAPHGVLRCASRVCGKWGQPARLHFAAVDVDYLSIAPDAVFALQPALLAADGSGACSGSFVFPIDDGAITFTLLLRSGEIVRHVVLVTTESSP